MYIFNILKVGGRRSGQDRRNTSDAKPNSSEKRSSGDRRTTGDRRNYSERRSGTHHMLTEQQKLQLERMCDFFEEKGLG
jgi:hypothetical protein